MAKYEITKSCGHTETVELYGANAERERKIKWLETQPCRSCQQIEANKAMEENKDGLPALEGSEKQIVWAYTIRANALPKLQAELKKNQDIVAGMRALLDNDSELASEASKHGMTPEEGRTRISNNLANMESCIEAIEAKINNTSAAWWINNYR